MNAAEQLVAEYGVDIVSAALRPLLSDERLQRIEEVLDARLGGLTVVLDNLHDPHNGAAAIRSLESFGLATLHVAETSEPFRFSAKVTIGCEKWLSILRYPDFQTCAAALHKGGVALHATLPGAELRVEQLDVTRPLALVFGNEHDGLSDAAIAACDGSVALPMFGFCQSFNLSVSVALLVERLASRRREALGQPGDLSIVERARLRAQWYATSVRAAEQIVARYVSESTHDDVAE